MELEIQVDKLVQIIGQQKVENAIIMDRNMALVTRLETLEKELAAGQKAPKNDSKFSYDPNDQPMAEPVTV